MPYQYRKSESKLSRSGKFYRKARLKQILTMQWGSIKKERKMEETISNSSNCLDFESTELTPPGSSAIVDPTEFIATTDYGSEPFCGPTLNFSYATTDKQLELLYDESDSLSDKLGLWITKNRISGEAADEILFVLRQSGHADLPKSNKTLRKTQTKLIMKQMGSGQYFTRNLRDMLVNRFRALGQNLKDLYRFDLSSDGIPVGKNSSDQLWPYMIALRDSEVRPMTWAVYCGRKKPSDPDVILKELRMQLINLCEKPIIIDGKQIKVEFHKFKGDLPSVSLHVCVKHPGGYSACRFCYVIGLYLPAFKKIVYVEVDCKKRSHRDFVELATSRPKDVRIVHVLKKSEFLEFVGFDCVYHVDIDAMHLFLFGETKKVINKWFFIKNDARLPPKLRKEMEEKLSTTFKQFPCEFNRHGRKFEDVNRWKATELKAFLMYQYLSVYKILPEKIRNHFLLLFCSVRILSHPIYYKKYNKLAERLLLDYVKQCKNNYGIQHYDLVTHLLIHISENASTNSLPIFEESCFQFENELKCLKDVLKAGPLPLQQVYYRLEEKEKYIEKFMPKKHDLPLFYFEKNEIEFNCFKLKPTLNDSFFMTKQKKIFRYISPKIVNNQLLVVASQIENLEPVFMYPFNSTFIEIFGSTIDNSENIQILNINDIQYKMFHLSPDSSQHIYIPLEHTHSFEFTS